MKPIEPSSAQPATCAQTEAAATDVRARLECALTPDIDQGIRAALINAVLQELEEDDD